MAAFGRTSVSFSRGFESWEQNDYDIPGYGIAMHM
jgi:hypothetical protein